MRYRKNWLKFLIGWLAVFLTRLLPFRPPNMEPVLATLMPFAKEFGAPGGFIFGFLSITLFDAFVGKIGVWTLITGVAYGLLGVGAAWFFKHRKASALNFLAYGIIGTILYDAATGLTIGPIFWEQPFWEALTGQIPFTLLHLAGNIALSLGASPIIYRWVVANKNLESAAAWKKMRAIAA